MDAFCEISGDFVKKVVDAACKDFLKALQGGSIFQSGEKNNKAFLSPNFILKF